MLYYGEEIGMPGQKGTAPWWDAYRREPMDWYAAELGPDHAAWFMEEDRWNQPDDGISVEEELAAPDSLLNHWREVLALRAKFLPAAQFRRGQLPQLLRQQCLWLGRPARIDGEIISSCSTSAMKHSRSP